MIEFAAALAVFFAAHVIPVRTGLRAVAIEKLGERSYIFVYSAISMALLAWVVSASIRAPFIPLWTPAPWAYLLPIIVMPFSFGLIATALLQPNPLSINFSRRRFIPENPGIIAITRHPVLWGFGLWAAAHIPPNGDLVSVILFGQLALFAFTGMILIDRARRRTLGQLGWYKLANTTSIIPFLAVILGRARLPNDKNFHLSLAIGLSVYILFMMCFHELLFGISPLIHVWTGI